MKIGIYIGGQLALAVMLTTVLCLWSVLSPSVTNATVYHVATTGNDSRSCTTAQAISTPKATIVSGITCLSAGDTLYIRQGTYISENLDTTRINIPSGTSWSNPVTIAGYPGETVIMLRGNIRMHGGAVTSYVIFNNIIIDCAVTECGIYLTAPVHHIRFSNMEVMNSTTSSNGAGMISGNASFLEFLNCKIHDAGAGNCSKYANQGCYGLSQWA